MRSWQSIVFEKFLLLRGSKKKFVSYSLMDEFIASKYDEVPYSLNSKFQQKHNIQEDEVNGMLYYTINAQATPSKIIYYFHGGAYINEPLIFHWRYLINLAKQTNFTIVVPIYPRLPRNHYEDAYKAIHSLYNVLLSKYDAPFIFMGDSAGGGLALGFAQDVKLTGKHQPEQIVLFSPWLDVRGEDPRYMELEKIDPMLGILGAQRLGKMWANGQDLTYYKISPLFGPLQHIGKITVFVGTAEVVLVDAQQLLLKAKEQNIDITYFEYENMNHVFPVFPIPEAKQALQQLIPIIKV